MIVGATGTDVCPVSALCQYSRAIFLRHRGKAITMSFFVHLIRDMLQSLGFPAHHYAGHSFRIGVATTQL